MTGIWLEDKPENYGNTSPSEILSSTQYPICIIIKSGNSVRGSHRKVFYPSGCAGDWTLNNNKYPSEKDQAAWPLHWKKKKKDPLGHKRVHGEFLCVCHIICLVRQSRYVARYYSCRAMFMQVPTSDEF